LTTPQLTVKLVQNATADLLLFSEIWSAQNDTKMSDFDAQLRFIESRGISTINVPVVYLARDVMILMRATSVTRAQIALASLVAMSGPKKVLISWPTPSNGLSNGFARIKIIKSKRHIKKQVQW
jgi:hypothetical protein